MCLWCWPGMVWHILRILRFHRPKARTAPASASASAFLHPSAQGSTKMFNILPLPEIKSPVSGFLSRWPVPGRLPHCQELAKSSSSLLPMDAKKALRWCQHISPPPLQPPQLTWPFPAAALRSFADADTRERARCAAFPPLCRHTTSAATPSPRRPTSAAAPSPRSAVRS